MKGLGFRGLNSLEMILQGIVQGATVVTIGGKQSKLLKGGYVRASIGEY